ncbi:hypothetical protein GCM10011376_15020 [Nocardioides flavus (ex Wang et al. 2016)]|uniref:Uncharacterized protein n=1 Tax=Nocardioides flavus (ex Wang et al. 2016) TaxID=2058780 RepID=A0ABQ3HKB9_9ACTN|nr:hypothetical protein GCM10011376_15020 [Nocardioides flavus (ex Wang et al. 2016)]
MALPLLVERRHHVEHELVEALPRGAQGRGPGIDRHDARAAHPATAPVARAAAYGAGRVVRSVAHAVSHAASLNAARAYAG